MFREDHGGDLCVSGRSVGTDTAPDGFFLGKFIYLMDAYDDVEQFPH